MSREFRLHEVPTISTLWRTNAIVTAGTVRLQRFAEKNQAIGEGEGLQRCPNGIDQIGASIHQNGNVGRAGDVEPKLIALDAKVGAAGLD